MTDRPNGHSRDEDAALLRFLRQARLQDGRLEDAPEFAILRLLGLTETLIAAHKAARLDGDDMTVELIEDALRHVGARLEKESVARHAAERDAARAG